MEQHSRRRLLDAAERGRLRDPAVLDAEVRRMLADPRADALTTNFASQWLYLRNLAAAVPNLRLFPDFDDNLRQAFRRETELFFESIVQEDRSVLDLLDADYTFLNERLARTTAFRTSTATGSAASRCPRTASAAGCSGTAAF